MKREEKIIDAIETIHAIRDCLNRTEQMIRLYDEQGYIDPVGMASPIGIAKIELKNLEENIWKGF